MKKLKIYLAGPDVFRENAVEFLQGLKDLCAEYGHEGLSPLDNEVEGDSTADLALEIYFGNIALVKECDVVIANLIPFRGPSVDDGTAFEIGYAAALGKRIYGYSVVYKMSLKDLTYAMKTGINKKTFPKVEDFGLSCNLMLAKAITESGGKIVGTPEEVLQDLDK